MEPRTTPVVRQNVWSLEGTWPDTLLWYARAIKKLQALPITTTSSWSFLAGIHGFNAYIWEEYGYLKKGAPGPSADNMNRFWDQCQHGSYYFFPWHRGYMYAFESIIREAITDLQGPSDWALPYWDMYQTGQNTLRPEFASQTWPDDSGTNPLYVPQRYGNDGTGTNISFILPADMSALSETDFTGVAVGGPAGFGGVKTGFSHTGSPHGMWEKSPHDVTHGQIGGHNAAGLQGLMCLPDAAGLDPIFWLHHCNVDRYWEIWLQTSTDLNPTDTDWLNGPPAGQRRFAMPAPHDSSFEFTPADVTDISVMQYKYDDLTPAPSMIDNSPSARVARLGKAAGATASGATVELLGANQGVVTLVGTQVATTVTLDPDVLKKVFATYADASPTALPDRLFLNLEHVRGPDNSIVFDVSATQRIGSIGLFGVSNASAPNGAQAGQGITYVVDMTSVFDALYLAQQTNVTSIDVQLVPLRVVAQSSQATIDRVSIFRQGR